MDFYKNDNQNMAGKWTSSHFYCSVRPELGAVEELRLSAFDRHHFQLSTSHIDPFHGHVLNFTHFGSNLGAFFM